MNALHFLRQNVEGIINIPIDWSRIGFSDGPVDPRMGLAINPDYFNLKQVAKALYWYSDANFVIRDGAVDYLMKTSGKGWRIYADYYQELCLSPVHGLEVHSEHFNIIELLNEAVIKYNMKIVADNEKEREKEREAIREGTKYKARIYQITPIPSAVSQFQIMAAFVTWSENMKLYLRVSPWKTPEKLMETLTEKVRTERMFALGYSMEDQRRLFAEEKKS